MVSHLASHWSRGLGQLENGLLQRLIQNNLCDIQISWPTPYDSLSQITLSWITVISLYNKRINLGLWETDHLPLP